MRFVRGFFILIGAVTTFAVLGAVAVAIFFGMRTPEVPDRTLLQLELDHRVVEFVPEDPWSLLAFGRRGPTLREIVAAVERAARDDRVIGLVADLGSVGIGLATVQELREAITAFGKTGKPTFIHAASFGEFSAANSAYYLATSFGKIYLQPSGDVGLTGLLVQSFFVREAFEKLDLKARLDSREQYKGVEDIFTEREFTAPQREALTRILESLSGQITEGIGAGRGLGTEDIARIMQRAPLSAGAALEAGLVDALLYADQVESRIKEELGQEVKMLSLDSYLARLEPEAGEPATVALIYGIGQIQSGRSEYSPFTGSLSMGSATISSAFRAAVEDEAVEAILFRVDSPGGSYVASDTIWREVVRAREQGKPVVVSMGNVAGSGGYFVAAPADKIVALPATITGSIGVVAGKFVTRGLWEKLGVSWDDVTTNSNATFWSELQDYTPEQWQRLGGLLDLIYDDFVTKVAEGRNLSKEEVLEVAKGRIWTGEDAAARGLVDELGGYGTALRVTREAANIPADRPIAVRLFPERRSRLELLVDRLLGAADEPDGIAIARPWEELEALAPIVRQVRALKEGSSPGVLHMPPVSIR